MENRIYFIWTRYVKINKVADAIFADNLLVIRVDNVKKISMDVVAKAGHLLEIKLFKFHQRQSQVFEQEENRVLNSVRTLEQEQNEGAGQKHSHSQDIYKSLETLFLIKIKPYIIN